MRFEFSDIGELNLVRGWLSSRLASDPLSLCTIHLLGGTQCRCDIVKGSRGGRAHGSAEPSALRIAGCGGQGRQGAEETDKDGLSDVSQQAHQVRRDKAGVQQLHKRQAHMRGYHSPRRTIPRMGQAIEAGDNEADCGEGYGPRTGPREASAAAGDNKRSRRFVPYESPERRTYKTIIPAPPKQRAKGSPLSSAGETPAIVPLALPPTAETHIPKRPRLEPEHPEPAGHTAPEQFVEQAPEVVLDVIEPVAPPPFTEYQYRYRYGDANRITISSLLTIDPESIAEYQSTQALHQYIPSFYFSSPLTDPTLVFAFKHFVEVVAPTMSLVESAPPNPSILNYQNYPDPGARAVNLFTFQLPMMALAGNWAVMEAILALSLLHIAHVTRSSKQQAYLHYQIAIKRLRIESSREGASRDLGILAVMLLLAWYELTTGDHVPNP